MQLAHHLLAVRLDRSFRCTEIVRNLLVELPFSDKSEDLPFAWREGIKERMQRVAS